MALFKKLIDENHDLEYVLLFNWGEPLLHPSIFEMIQYAADAGIRTYITTNGTLWNATRIEALLDSKLERLTISLDGLGPVYEKVRGVSYEKVTANIEQLFAARTARGSSLKIDVAMTVSDLNEANVADFVAAWKSKADRVQIQPAQNMGMESTPYGRRRENPCAELWRGNLIVLWDGAVVGCCVDHDGTMRLGNAWGEPVKRILNGAKMRVHRRQHLAKQFLGICGRCDEYDTPFASHRFK
jgi:organic radical activating enzyme